METQWITLKEIVENFWMAFETEAATKIKQTEIGFCFKYDNEEIIQKLSEVSMAARKLIKDIRPDAILIETGQQPIKRESHCVILNSMNSYELGTQITRYLNQGYIPHGSLQVTDTNGGMHFQTMIKY